MNTLNRPMARAYTEKNADRITPQMRLNPHQETRLKWLPFLVIPAIVITAFCSFGRWF